MPLLGEILIKLRVCGLWDGTFASWLPGLCVKLFSHFLDNGGDGGSDASFTTVLKELNELLFGGGCH